MAATGAATTQQRQAMFRALDDAPMEWRQYGLWFVASGGTLLDGFSIFALGVAMPLIVERFGLSPLMVGLIGSALVAGAALGAAVGGRAADRFGRKPLFLADVAILAVGGFMSAAAEAPLLVLLGQLLVGIGIGIDFPVSASYVSETMPRRARSRMVVATIALQSVGMLVGAAAAIATLRYSSSLADWRWIVGATGAGACAYLVLRVWLPESPRWLLERGRETEAASIVARMVTVTVASAPSAPPTSAPTATPAAATGPGAPVGNADASLATLFSPALRSRTLLVSGPWFLMDIATYGVGLFTPIILGAVDPASTATTSIASDLSNAKGTAAIDLFLLLGFLAGLYAVPRFGRIRMQIAGFGGMTLGMLTLLIASTSEGGAATHVPLVFAGFILFNLAMNTGPNATTFTLAPELFPTSLRATASGFAAATAKVGATLGIFVLPQIKAVWGVSGVLALMAAVSALGLVATLVFAREMREVPEGLGLEDVSSIR
jgi:MFS family permease